MAVFAQPQFLRLFITISTIFKVFWRLYYRIQCNFYSLGASNNPSTLGRACATGYGYSDRQSVVINPPSLVNRKTPNVAPSNVAIPLCHFKSTMTMPRCSGNLVRTDRHNNFSPFLYSSWWEKGRIIPASGISPGARKCCMSSSVRAAGRMWGTNARNDAREADCRGSGTLEFTSRHWPSGGEIFWSTNCDNRVFPSLALAVVRLSYAYAAFYVLEQKGNHNAWLNLEINSKQF